MHRTAFGAVQGVVTVDGTQVVTTPTFHGCGKLALTEYPRNRQGVRVETMRFVFG